MTQAVLETRPLYGIGTVARLTGLKPDTLRVWERRYGLGASHKSSTGRRQYTQADLEHLQLVAALVSSGSRIGEIASVERKTLSMLLRQRKDGRGSSIPPSRPRVVFVGERLCEWLDDHQGCVATVEALLLRAPLSSVESDLVEEVDSADALVVECASLGSRQARELRELQTRLGARRVIVVYEFASERWLKELEDDAIVTSTFPPESAFIAFELARLGAEKTARAGDANLGELMSAKPPQFNEMQLRAARNLTGALDCECPRHIADLIRSLSHFEEYSSTCSVENWHDAAVHACIYAYTSQARWLMEKALQAVLENHEEDYARLCQSLGEKQASIAGAA